MELKWICPKCGKNMTAKPYEEGGVESARAWVIECECGLGMNVEIYRWTKERERGRRNDNL